MTNVAKKTITITISAKITTVTSTIGGLESLQQFRRKRILNGRHAGLKSESTQKFRRSSEAPAAVVETPALPTVCDNLVALGVTLLIVLSPFGLLLGDERWLRMVEITVFTISGVWAGKMLWLNAYGEAQAILTKDLWRLLIPLGALVLWFAVQLIPLPPVVIRMVSPATYQVYEKSLVGWPSTPPYAGLMAASSTLDLARWRPLSLCTDLTLREAVRFSCFSALMAISAFYSFGGSHGEESRFIRRGIFAIVAVSSIVALWGLLSVLSPQIGQTEVRARGPFINADHFANYLGMMAPLALAGVLYPGSYVKGSWCDPFRIIAGVAFLVTSSAIFVSLSRAGWIIWTLGCLLLIGSTVLSRRSAEPGDAFEVRPAVGSRTRIIIGFGAVLLFLVAVSLVLGDRGQRLLGQRITDTMSNEASFTGRTEVWRASLPMLRDFPVVGVGLGVWPDIFDRYQQPPYDGRFFWGAAHNDYLQFAIETGIVGTGLLLWFWSQLAAHLIRSRSVLNSRAIPMYMALLAGMAAMAAHEMADFSFRTTANAVLFCVLAGFALRISQKRNPTQVDRLNRSWKLSTLAAGLSALTVVFLTTQPAVAYPEQVYSTESRAYWQSPAQAIPALVQLIAEHPGRADPHLAMIHSLGLEKKWTEIDREIDAAMWLEPISPIARDWHAYRLERSGRVQEAFAEITRSVMQSPRLETHDSLKKQNLERLGPGEKHAVEMGLQQAVAGGYAEAVPQLAEYYSLSNRHIDEAELYLRTAGQQPESSQQERFLLAAGEAFEQAGDDRKAKSTFEMAAKIAPSDAGPYLGLISVADGPTKDMAGAQAAVGIGIRNGVDPVVLYSALAETAQLANRSEIASAALAKVVEYAPTFQNNLHLADFYLATGKADRAVDTLRKVTMIAPDSAEAYVRLATAEEAAYLYADADRDYSHALSLEPNNAEAKSRYAEFQHRTADKGTSAMGDPGN